MRTATILRQLLTIPAVLSSFLEFYSPLYWYFPFSGRNSFIIFCTDQLEINFLSFIFTVNISILPSSLKYIFAPRIDCFSTYKCFISVQAFGTVLKIPPEAPISCIIVPGFILFQIPALGLCVPREAEGDGLKCLVSCHLQGRPKLISWIPASS